MRCPRATAIDRKSGCRNQAAARILSCLFDQAESRRPSASRAYRGRMGHPEEMERGMAAAAEPARGRWGSLRSQALPPAGTRQSAEIVPVGEPRPVCMPIDSDPASGWSRSPPKSGRLQWLGWSPDRRESAMLSAAPPARSWQRTLRTLVPGRLVVVDRPRQASGDTND